MHASHRSSSELTSLRLDKWLWAARFYKTRSIAVEEIGKGRVTVNGQAVKASRELRPGDMVQLRQGVVAREVKVLGLSVDPVERHALWAKDIAETQGAEPDFPMIGDPTLSISKLYGMLPADAGESCEGRTAADNATVRNVYVIGPDKKIKLVLSYPMTAGRNFAEILRIIDSLQLTAKHRVATPADWQQGQEVIIVPAVSDDEAKGIYPNGWRTEKPYLRYVPQPKA